MSLNQKSVSRFVKQQITTGSVASRRKGRSERERAAIAKVYTNPS